MAAQFRLGSSYASLVADAIFRGVIGTPSDAIYVSLGGSGGFVTKNEASQRTKLIRSRGLFNGMYGTDYFHESPRSALVDSSSVVPIAMHFSEGMSDTTVTKLLAHDAASGGNLLFCALHADMFAFGGDTMGYYVPAVADGIERKTVLLKSTEAPAWIGSIIHDWLFRGYDSFNSWFPTSTFPNVYVRLEKADGSLFNTTNNNIAIARSTSSWSAATSHGTDAIPRMKITNTTDISFGTANEANSGTNARLRIKATNATQSFDDTLAKVVNVFIPWALNDTVVIPAGALEIEIH